ncbi:MAG: 16S rRNA (cytosine(1402)-N(4))-methyltransferase RsmH [Chitinophagales bacterium]|nr:16S rRNA (cytosine(1402)-N(4))-methyltransferase RsmH [Chitinophagales bacterium]
MEQQDYHISVLLHECTEALQINPNGKYVDVTFGGGGHSKEILKKLNKGVLYAFDQDKDAVGNLIDNENLVFVGHNFRFLKRFLKYREAIPVNGILADLGISSFQIDEGEKGFSTRFDGPLDMRMNQSAALTAQKILEQYSEDDLVRVFSEYGEVRNSKTLAKEIVNARGRGVKFETTSSFISFLEGLVMGGNPNRYFAQVFQALRIEVNDEMEALKEMLQQAYEVLAEGGILAVITFHSLEDRLVKNFMKTGNFEGERITDEFGVSQKYFKVLTKKPIEASKEELKLNARSRSAKLRVAQKI